MDEEQKFVTKSKNKRSESTLASQHSRHKSNNSRTLLLYFIILVVLAVVSLYIFQEKAPTSQLAKNSINSEPVTQISSKNTFKKIQAQYNLSRYFLPLNSVVNQRIINRNHDKKALKIKIFSLYKRAAPTKFSHCALTNAISFANNVTTMTATSFIVKPQVYKWIIFFNMQNKDSAQTIQKYIQFMNKSSGYQFEQKQNVIFDSDYKFISDFTVNCNTMIYLQNHFQIESEQATKFVNTSSIIRADKLFGYIGYSIFTITQDGAKSQLKDIYKQDLSNFPQQQYLNYVFIFDVGLLDVITPLNFQIYNKYTLQQMIIYPMLALTQKSMDLVPFKFTFHTIRNSVYSPATFQLTPPVKIRENQYCFVNYPIEPKGIFAKQFNNYITSISQMLKNNTVISVISHFGYDLQRSNETLFQVYKSIKQFKQKFPNLRVKIRIHNKKAVSSLSVYESVHNFCPDSSIIVASRSNIQYDERFLANLTSKITTDYHYFFPGRLKYLSHSELFTNKIQRRYIARKLITDFSEVQIFKSDFMKMIDIWNLQVDQGSFYQAQSSYVLPMLQMTGLHVQQLFGTKIKVSHRIPTQNENFQMDLLNKHSRWNKLQGNKLWPIKYNGLLNQFFNTNTKVKIPKIIHQIWLKDAPIPAKIQKLQETIKNTNKGYKYKIWKRDMLNPYDFPQTYSLIMRILQYQQGSGKSFHPWIQALMSYQILYNEGGIYLALKSQCRKPLDSFLKHQLFFAGYYNTIGDYSTPMSIGRDVIGCTKHSFNIKILLQGLIDKNRINLQLSDYEALVGGDLIRATLSNRQLYQSVGFGFNLFTYDIYRTSRGLCHINHIPCHQYKQAYVVLHNLV